MQEREYQAECRVTREAIVKVMARDPDEAELRIARGQWEEILPTQHEKLADIEIVTGPHAVEDWRNPT